MTSSSSLYGTVNAQNSSSTNSTSLYGEAGTPIPDSSGNVIVRGDLYVLSGNILTTATTGNIFPENATTINIGLAATTFNIGANTGTTTVNNDLDVTGDLIVNGTFVAPNAEFGNITIAVLDDNTISTTSGALILDSATNTVDINANTYIQAYLNVPDIATTNIQATSASGLNLYNNDASNAIHIYDNYVQIVSGTISGADWVFNEDGTTSFPSYVFPYLDGTANQVLTTNGSGVLSFTDVGSLDTNYTIDASATTGGTNFNLQGSDATTDTIKFANGTGVAVSRTSASEIGFAIGQDVATSSNVTFADITATNDLTVQGNNVNLAQATTIGYSENNNRANRLEVQSTTGNSSGFRILAPNATTSANSNLTVLTTNDINNTSLISVQAIGSTTVPFNIRTGTYTAGVFGASSKPIQIIDGSTTYATINPAGPTNGTDLTTKTYVDGLIPTVVTYAIDATSTTGGANLNLVGSNAITDSVAYKGSGATTVTRTDASTITISSTDANTTYTYAASNTSGGANLTLTGSDSTTNTIKLTNGTGVTNTYISATEVSVGIGQAVGSTDSPIFAGLTLTGATTGSSTFTAPATGAFLTYTLPGSGGAANSVLTNDGGGTLSWALPGGGGSTFGNVSVGVDTDQTISTTSGNLILQTAGGVNAGTITMASGTNGNITLAPNGTGVVSSGLTRVATASRVLGQMYGTQSTTWTPPATGQTTMTGQNGFYASSSSGGANGYGSTIQSRYYSGDTTLGTSTTATLVGGSATGTNAAPGALANGQVLVSLNADAYATTGWAGTIATGTQTPTGIAIVPAQLQFYSREAFADNGTNVTAGGTGMRVRLFNAATTYTAANRVSIIDHTTTTATYKAATFNIQPAASTSNYAVFSTATGSINQDTFTLKNNAATTTYATFNSTSAALNGDTVNLNNTAGTTNIASFTPSGSTITATGPIIMARTSAVAASPSGQILRLSRTDVAGPTDGDGIDFRLSVGGTSTNSNFARFTGVYRSSGLNEIGMSVSTDSFSADSDQVYIATAESTKIQATPSGGGAVSTILTVDAAKITAAVPFKFPTYTIAAAGAITGALGWQISISDSPIATGRMAYWTTTATAGWRYVDTNLAI